MQQLGITVLLVVQMVCVELMKHVSAMSACAMRAMPDQVHALNAQRVSMRLRLVDLHRVLIAQQVLPQV